MNMANNKDELVRRKQPKKAIAKGFESYQIARKSVQKVVNKKANITATSTNHMEP